MNIACTLAQGTGGTDLLLEKAAGLLMGRGMRLSGTVQVNSEAACDGPCDMDVRVLPDGPVIRISQSLGKGSKGCRLDPAALEAAVGIVASNLSEETDLLIVNKFGRHEADGNGFRPVIAAALAQGIPVLVGMNRLNYDAFEEFSGGVADNLPPDAEGIVEWVMSCHKEGAHAKSLTDG